MLIYAMDTDYYVLQKIEEEFEQMRWKDRIKLFTNVVYLWKAFEAEPPDLVIVEQEAYDSCALLHRIKDRNPEQKILLTHGSDGLPPEVVNLKIDGIISKPVTGDKLREEIFKIKHPVLAKMRKAI